MKTCFCFSPAGSPQTFLDRCITRNEKFPPDELGGKSKFNKLCQCGMGYSETG
jgi:hypothetical protein